MLLSTTNQKWCRRRKYNFSQAKAEEIYRTAGELIPVLPKDSFTKRIIKQAAAQLNAVSQTVEQLRSLMNETAARLPEYPVVMSIAKGLSYENQGKFTKAFKDIVHIAPTEYRRHYKND